jgi:hypothetical protein
MKDSFLFLFLRRMRVPLVVLISAYSIATVGFTLIPGVDDQGNPWRMSVFEAFYVVSYTGSTIGFGEVPYAFSPAQRAWTMVSIYVTVIAWLFSIGSIVSLLQDPAYIQGAQAFASAEGRPRTERALLPGLRLRRHRAAADAGADRAGAPGGRRRAPGSQDRDAARR